MSSLLCAMSLKLQRLALTNPNISHDETGLHCGPYRIGPTKNLYRIGPRSEVGGRREAKSGEVLSRLEGGGQRAESDKKRSKNFVLGTPVWSAFSQILLETDVQPAKLLPPPLLILIIDCGGSTPATHRPPMSSFVFTKVKVIIKKVIRDYSTRFALVWWTVLVDCLFSDHHLWSIFLLLMLHVTFQVLRLCLYECSIWPSLLKLYQIGLNWQLASLLIICLNHLWTESWKTNHAEN